MKHLSARLLPWSIFLPLFFGCGDYISFGDEIALPEDRLPASDQLAISAMLMNTDTALYLRTDRAISFQQGYRIDGPPGQSVWPRVDENDLTIGLRSGGTEVASFRHIPEAERFGSQDVFDPDPWQGPVYPAHVNYRSPASGAVLEAGRSYRLAIDHPELGPYAIEERMPAAVSSGSLRVSGVLSNSSGSAYRNVNLRFRDPAGEENYYLIEAIADSLTGNLLTLDDADPRTPEGERLRSSLFFSGAGADGQLVELDFFASVPFDEGIAGVRVTSVSPGWYRFMESYQRYFELREDLNDGLTEPFQLYTNVPDGFGFFGLGNQVVIVAD